MTSPNPPDTPLTSDTTPNLLSAPRHRQDWWFEAVLNSGTEAILVIDREGRFLYVSPAGAKAIGIDADKIIGKMGFEIGAPTELVTLFESERQKVADTGQPLYGKVTYPTPDGLRDFEYSWNPLRIDNAIQAFLFAARDVTELNRAAEALRESEERFRLALAHSDITVYKQDRDLRYTWTYSGQTQTPIEAVLGKRDTDILEAEDAAALIEIKRRVLETGVGERHVVRATLRGAEPRYYDTVFEPLYSPNGAIIGITGTTNDITERKRAQDDLAQRQATIQQLNVRLWRAMSETHHRVKNSLQLIIALIEMQITEGVKTVSVEVLHGLRLQALTLATVHDILTQQARKGGEANRLSVQEMLSSLISMLQITAGKRPIHAEVQDQELEIRQATSLALIVTELISNGIKHGKGEVQVTFMIRRGEGVLEVCDDGAGFPQGFDPRAPTQAGIDLVESLAHWDLRGKTLYENRPEGGARVVVTFPLA